MDIIDFNINKIIIEGRKKFKNLEMNMYGGSMNNMSSVPVTPASLTASPRPLTNYLGPIPSHTHNVSVPKPSYIPSSSRIDHPSISRVHEPYSFQKTDFNKRTDTRYLDYQSPSKMMLYKIPIGTLLYHGTTEKESFNPFDFKLDDKNLIAMFSPNKRLAVDYVKGCAEYPNKQGYIHLFRTTKDINRILVVSTYEKTRSWDVNYIEKTFCDRQRQLDGIGFFFPRLKESSKKVDNVPENIIFDAEFALCDPSLNLEYLSTEKCQSMRHLSKPYHFTL